MKIQVISDLHREFGFMDISFDGADLVVLAGDINLGTKGIDWIKINDFRRSSNLRALKS